MFIGKESRANVQVVNPITGAVVQIPIKAAVCRNVVLRQRSTVIEGGGYN